KAIEYPGEMDEELKRVVKIAVHLRLLQIRKNRHYNKYDIEGISGALAKIGESLAEEPYKTKFRELARNALPAIRDLEEIIAIVREAGISEEEYKSLIQKAVEVAEERDGKSSETFKLRKLLEMPIITEDFLRAGDTYLKKGEIDRACSIYEKFSPGTIGKTREKIIAVCNRISKRGYSWLKWQKIRRMAKKLGIEILRDC
ncbi:MAG: hypothetical protein QME61_03040, partial [Patescibacteria group bacterium]|nr:hypothetical protein [Patescibacteria group bacterium]